MSRFVVYTYHSDQFAQDGRNNISWKQEENLTLNMMNRFIFSRRKSQQLEQQFSKKNDQVLIISELFYHHLP